jgi:hypothetical protein
MNTSERRSTATRLAVASLATALALTAPACGSGDDDGDGTGSGVATTTTAASSGGVPAPGGGLTVEEALTTDAAAKLLVHGYVVANGDVTKICESLTTSNPPGCGGRSATLEGFDTATLDGSSGETRWSTTEQRILVDRDGDTFTASSTSR